MKIHLVVSCWLLSVVCVKVSAVIQVSGFVGGEVIIECPVIKTLVFSLNNKQKYFSKDNCLNKKVSTEGGERSATNGRYSIYDRGDTSFTVTISDLEKSDSGKYWCGVVGFVENEHREVFLIVMDAPPKPSTLRPRPAVSTTINIPTTSTNLSTTSTNLSTTSTNLSTTSTNLSKMFLASGDLGEAASSISGRSLWSLYAIVGLVVTVLGLALLVFYRKWRGGNRKSPESSNNLANTAAGQDDSVYEVVGEEDRQTDSLPAVVSVKSPNDRPATASASYPASQDTVGIPNDMYGNISFPNDAIDPSDFPKGRPASLIYSNVSQNDPTILPSPPTGNDLYSMAQLPNVAIESARSSTRGQPKDVSEEDPFYSVAQFPKDSQPPTG